MKRFGTVVIVLLAVLALSSLSFAQVADGVNKYSLVKPLSEGVKGVDSLGTEIGRDVIVVPGPNSLDGDNLVDLVVTDYQGSGRVHVFEQASANSAKFNLVWSSKTPLNSLAKNKVGPQSTPRTVTVGDFDGNGRKEIIFPLGYAPIDSVDSDTTLPRGLHIYEWNGTNDNSYGSAPLRIIKPTEIDTGWVTRNFGRVEGQGLAIDDVDGDGKAELILGSREFGITPSWNPVCDLHILQVTSGTFAGGNAVVNVEYTYHDMHYVNDDGLKADSSDGFIPFGFGIADIDGDGKKEIMVAGWVNVASGSGLGFIDVPSANTYVDGTVMAFPGSGFGGTTMAQVSFRPAVRNINGQDYIYFNGDSGPTRAFYTVDGVSDVGLVSAANLKKISVAGLGSWCGLLAVDADHGNGSDGFEIYFPNGQKVSALEYKQGLDPTDSTNYTFVDSVFTLSKVFKTANGAITDVIGYQGMDLNGNGKREIIVNYKPGTDTLIGGNKTLTKGNYAFFVVEWGDSNTVVTSVGDMSPVVDNFRLDQNYPNPFNPATMLRFHVPSKSNVTMKIFDINGREIRTLLNGVSFEAGNHGIEWDGKGNGGVPAASGTYFYRLTSGDFSTTRQMVLVK